MTQAATTATIIRMRNTEDCGAGRQTRMVRTLRLLQHLV
jgi:hypothetical protein